MSSILIRAARSGSVSAARSGTPSSRPTCRCLCSPAKPSPRSRRYATSIVRPAAASAAMCKRGRRSGRSATSTYLPVASGQMCRRVIGYRSRRLRRIGWAASPTSHRPSACAQLWRSSEISVSSTEAILVGPADIGRPGSLPRLVRAAFIRKITVTEIDRSTRCSHRRT